MNSITLSNPFTLSKGQVIKNRLFKSAMSEQLGDKQAAAEVSRQALQLAKPDQA